MDYKEDHQSVAGEPPWTVPTRSGYSEGGFFETSTREGPGPPRV